MFIIIALFRIAKNQKQFKYLSTEKWINKLRYTDTVEYYSTKGTNYHTCNICESQKHYVEQKKLNPRIHTV